MTPDMTPALSATTFRSADPDEFGTSATPEHGTRFVLRTGGAFDGVRRRVVAGDLLLNHGWINLDATFHTAVGERVILSVAPGPHPGVTGEAAIGGIVLPPRTLVWWRAGAEVHARWPAGLPWWNLVLPLPRLQAAARILLGHEVALPREALRLIPISPERHAAILATLADFLDGAPAPSGADAVIRFVVEAVSSAADGRGVSPDPAATSRARLAAIADGLVALADRTSDPLPLTAVCEELGVPVRTLNAAGNAILGTSAALYLRRRRLMRTQADLRRGEAPSVTEAAMRHGFLELGRFAADYRALFGEAPSATLQQARATPVRARPAPARPVIREMGEGGPGRDHAESAGPPDVPTRPLAVTFRARDPEAFGAGATPTHASRLVLRGRGPFEGRRERLLAGATVLNRGRTSVPATFHNDVGPRAIFSLAAGDPVLGTGEEPAIQGRPFGRDALVWWRAGAEIHTRWPAGLPWWNLVTPLARLDQAARALVGAPLLPPGASAAFLPLTPAARRRLDEAFGAAIAAPEGIATERLEGDLLSLLVGVLGALPDAAAAAPGLPREGRLRIVDGLVAIGDRAEEQPSLDVVCGELGAPLRTLNAACDAVLGVSAAAYLRARRLSRVFHALDTNAAASVTDAATRHGFWEFGRFAGAYRAAFGEPPSATLRRGRGRTGDG